LEISLALLEVPSLHSHSRGKDIHPGSHSQSLLSHKALALHP
jgi:hypothetical protein